MKNDIYNKELNSRNFTSFVWPSILMMVILALYYTIDTIFVAKFVGDMALAALNIAYPVQGIMWGLSVMLAAGSSALVGIRMGNSENKKADRLFTFSNVATFVIGCMFTIIIFLLLNPIVVILGSTDSLTESCNEFLRIFIWGMPFAFLGTSLEFFVRVDGRPGFTVFLYVIGGVVHLGVDILLMGIYDMGLTGAAIANVCGLLATSIAGISYFLFMKTRLHFAKFKNDLHFLWMSIANGSPEFINEAAGGIMILFCNYIAIGLAGESGVAAAAIVLNLHYFFVSIHIGFANGTLPLLSFYYGAKRGDLINRVIKYSRNFITVSSIAISIGVFVFANNLVMLYEEPGSDIFYYSVRGLKIAALSLLVCGFNIYISTFFTAFGKGIISSLISASRGFVVLLVAMIICAKIFGINGVWYALPASEFVTLVLSFYLILRYRRKFGYSLR